MLELPTAYTSVIALLVFDEDTELIAFEEPYRPLFCTVSLTPWLFVIRLELPVVMTAFPLLAFDIPIVTESLPSAVLALPMTTAFVFSASASSPMATASALFAFDFVPIEMALSSRVSAEKPMAMDCTPTVETGVLVVLAV